jgi:hypothetical protein
MAKRPGYYREYGAAHINSHRFLAKAAREVVERLGKPYGGEEDREASGARPMLGGHTSNNHGSSGLTPSEPGKTSQRR